MNAPAPNAATPWLVIVALLPSEDPAVRMRLLRTLETLGAAALREGAYLMPDTPANRQAAERLAEYIGKNGGQAHVLNVAPGTPAREEAFRHLFDRAARYETLTKVIESLAVGFDQADPGAIARVLQKQRRELESIRGLDYFPSEARARAERALAHAEQAIQTRQFGPGQASAHSDGAESLLGRTWVTRRPAWADRLASAWLIRRFIDPEASVRWLDTAQAPAADALSFGFQGARFASAPQRVTFRVLLAYARLESNAALARIGTIVQFLESGGEKIPEAAGVEILLKGAQRRAIGEDELLAETEKTFDLLYEAYMESTTR